MTTPTLKPCPNPGCGSSTAPFITFAAQVNSYREVFCGICGMRGPQAKSDEKAATLWNSLPRTPEVDPLREAVEQAVSDLCRMGFDWQENRYSLKAQGGRGLFLRTTHVESRLRDALERHPIPMPPPPGDKP